MTKFFSKTRRILLLSILCVALAALSVFGLVACASEWLTEDDLIEMGYTAVVYFDYNGGAVNNESSLKMRLKDGSKVPNPSSAKNQLSNPVRYNYSFKNYVTAKLDENGAPRRDENGEIIPDKVWDFKNDVVTGEITLYAQWWNNYKLCLHYGDGPNDVKISYVSRNVDGTPNKLVSADCEIDGYTVIDYYYDKDFSNRIPSVPMEVNSTMFEGSADGLTLDVWCDALEGKYTIVKQASDFPAIKSDTNIYLYQDVKIPADTNISFPDSYSGKFIGAGHTLTDLQVSVSSNANTDYFYGMFKSLGAGAEITDVTFENVSLNVSLSAALQRADVALFAGQVREGAKVDNVKVSGSINCEAAVGFSAFDHLDYYGFAANTADGTVTDSNVVGNVAYVKPMTIMTADEDYAAYAKYTENGDDINLIEVYGLATVAGNVYTALRPRTITENSYGTTYTLTTSRGNYCIVINKNAAGYVAEVTASTVVYTEDKNFGVYIKSVADGSATQLRGVYGLEVKGADGKYVECEIVSITDNGNGSYTVTTDNAVYTVSVNQSNNAFAVSVAKA